MRTVSSPWLQAENELFVAGLRGTRRVYHCYIDSSTVTTVLNTTFLRFFNRSCAGYLIFADDLKELLDEWHLGDVGFSAYRRNFCSRSLTIEVHLGYVQMC